MLFKFENRGQEVVATKIIITHFLSLYEPVIIDFSGEEFLVIYIYIYIYISLD